MLRTNILLAGPEPPSPASSDSESNNDDDDADDDDDVNATTTTTTHGESSVVPTFSQRQVVDAAQRIGIHAGLVKSLLQQLGADRPTDAASAGSLPLSLLHNVDETAALSPPSAVASAVVVGASSQTSVENTGLTILSPPDGGDTGGTVSPIVILAPIGAQESTQVPPQ